MLIHSSEKCATGKTIGIAHAKAVLKQIRMKILPQADSSPLAIKYGTTFCKQTMGKPRVVFLFSGKRKSGKDYVTGLIQERLGTDVCSILRLSGPLKEQYAKEHNLDYQRLLDASDYKEKYRADMIRWGEEKRNADPGFFCRIIASGPGSDKPVWIISDCRRQTDIAYFKDHYSEATTTVRVQASEAVRESRGWKFTPGVDDVESECGLDTGVKFDIVVENDGEQKTLEQTLDKLCGMATKNT